MNQCLNVMSGVILVAFIIIGANGCSGSSKGHEGTEASERAKRDRTRLAEFASRHNASTNWMETLPDRGFGKCFTIDVAKVLIRTNAEPVAMETWLDDVSERDGVLLGHFTLFPINMVAPGKLRHFPGLELHLVLRCDAAQAEYLMKRKAHKFASLKMLFAVVARVESVSRPAFEAVTSEDGDRASIEFGSIPQVFFAKGTCIDLTYLGED